jgi:hypothetical protein
MEAVLEKVGNHDHLSHQNVQKMLEVQITNFLVEQLVVQEFLQIIKPKFFFKQVTSFFDILRNPECLKISGENICLLLYGNFFQKMFSPWEK